MLCHNTISRTQYSTLKTAYRSFLQGPPRGSNRQDPPQSGGQRAKGVREEEKNILRKERFMNKEREYRCNLKTIVEQADKGYIDDPEEVEEVLHDLLCLPLKRIEEVDADDNMSCFYSAIRDSDLIGDIDYTTVKYMTLMDLLVVIDHVPEDDNYISFEDVDGPGFAKCCFKLLVTTLYNYRKYIPEVYRFMYTTIGSLLKGEFNEFSSFCRKELGEKTYTNQTVAAVFDIFFKNTRSSWLPWFSPADYIAKVLSSYQMMDTLMIKNMRKAYPEEMSFDYVREKYQTEDTENYYGDESMFLDNGSFDDDMIEEKPEINNK